MSLTHSNHNYLVNDIMHGNVAWPSMTLETKNDDCTESLHSVINPNHSINNIFHSMNNISPVHGIINNNAIISYRPPQTGYTFSAQSTVGSVSTVPICYAPIHSSNYSNINSFNTPNQIQSNTCSECNQRCHCEHNNNYAMANTNTNTNSNVNTYTDKNTFTINTLNTITNQHQNEVSQLHERISICKNELAIINKQKVEQQHQIEVQQSKIEMLLRQTPDSATDYKGQCQTMHLCADIINKYLNVPSEFMNPVNDKCFCSNCYNNQSEDSVFSKGSPPRKYSLPLEWVRFGLTIDEGKCKMNNVFEDWHIAYHGTSRETAKQIFKSGLNLLKPGDYTIDGHRLSISKGHIRDCIWRRNLYLNQNEWFDPNQIFVSPSIVYASNEIYAKPFYCFNDTLKVQCAFEVRIRPNCYGTGQETINASKQQRVVDESFSNNELEWYTKENVGIVVHALLVKITSLNNESNNNHDPMYIDLT